MCFFLLLFGICLAQKEIELPDGPIAPPLIAEGPSIYWSWDRIPTSFHGGLKTREYNETEIQRLAKYQMVTIEKWYTPCGAATPQSDPSCGQEYHQVRALERIKKYNPKITGNLYWNSMFDFSFYGAHAKMWELEAQGVKAFLRDKTGEIIYLCADGNAYCNVTTFNHAEPLVRKLWTEVYTSASILPLYINKYVSKTCPLISFRWF